MQGYTGKMFSQLGQPVKYELPLNDEKIYLNSLIGSTITLKFTGRIRCIHCQKTTKKSFNQGYCYPCFTKLAQCDMCIMKPETCHYQAGTCREPAWGETFCFQPHVVYLANSSGIKVGITRHTQTPTRWIDQGALQALPIFRVQSRLQSGLIEVALAKHVCDKTNWQQMLKSHAEPIDLVAKRDELMAVCRDELADIKERFDSKAIDFLADEKPIIIDYPIKSYPTKIKSLNFDKEPEVSGILQGIKGQYLLLDSGVLNIRKFTGYELDFKA